MRIFDSVRSRLIALIILAAMPALILLGFSTWNTERLQIQQAHIEAQRLAILLANHHERLIGTTVDLMRTLAQSEEIRAGNAERCNRYLGRVLEQQSLYADFLRTDLDGNVDCASRPLARPLQMRDSAFFTERWDGEEFHVTPYTMDRASGRPVLLVTRRVQGPGGRPTGFLSAAVGLDWLSETFGSLELAPGAVMMITDASGRVMMHYPQPGTWIGQMIADQPLGRAILTRTGGAKLVPGLDGERRIFGFQALRGAGDDIRMAVGVPLESALALASLQRNYNIAAMLVALLGIAAATWYASHALVLRWTDRVLGTARTVTAGQYSARVGGPYDSGELGELARTFDRMLDEVTRREGELQAREEWFRSVVQHSTDMITIVDAEGNCRYASPAAERVLGYPAEELEGKSPLELVHPDERTRYSEIFKYLAGQPNRIAAAEHRLRHADGYYVFVESVGVNLLGNPAVAGIVVNSRDVTRRRRVEEMLRLVTSAVDQAREGMMIMTARLDDEGPGIVYVNPAIVRLTGYEEHELIGETPRVFRGDGVEAFVLDNLRRCHETGQDCRFEVQNRSKDGRSYPLELHVAPLKDENGRTTHFVAIARDMTEERKAEAEKERLEATLRQALKMEAVGTLAGGIAHDFNNVLLPMMMLTQLTLNRLPAESRERQDLTRVLAAQKRAKALVGQILAFSRGSSGEYVDVDLAAICRETLNLLRASLPATVTLIENLADTPAVRADPTQVQQVLMNLCSNAAQAMPSGKGTIEVRLDAVSLDTGSLPDPLKPGDYCRLEVADDGSGIPPAIVNRIFDPFFTTKEVGVGTGLGLSVVHGIVTAHHGAITVDTEPGRGTTFTIYLPVKNATASAEPMRASA